MAIDDASLNGDYLYEDKAYFLCSVVSDTTSKPHCSLLYHIWFYQRSRNSRRCILRDVRHGSGFWDYGVWLGRSKMVRQAVKKGRVDPLGITSSCCPQNFLREAFALFLRPFPWLNQAHLDYPGEPFLLKSQLIVDFNHICKIPTQQHLD